MEALSDSEWIRQLKEDDPQTIEKLWEMLFRFGVAAARRYEQPDDVGRDAAVSAYKRIRERGVYQYNFESRFSTYCYSIVVHEILRFLKKASPPTIDLEDAPPASVSHSDSPKKVDIAVIWSRLQPCLDELDGRNRQILQYLYLEQLAPGEVASRLNITTNYVNVIAFKIRRQLKDCLKAHGFESSIEVLEM